MQRSASVPSVPATLAEEYNYFAFAEILKKCGDFGRYQLMLLTLFGFISVVVSMHYFAQTMICFEPRHWCYHEKLANRTMQEIEKIYEKFERPYCTKLADIAENGTAILSDESCTRWIYNYDYNYISMIADLNWVCANEYKSSVGQSCFFIGSVFGTLIYGCLSDRYGRLPVLIMSNFSGFCGDFLTIFTRDVWSFSICRFISGLAVDTNNYLMYIIVLEYISPKWRIIGLNLIVGIFTCIGLIISPWLAVATGYWKYFLISSSSPLLLVALFYFFVQESAQWLLTTNQSERAIRRLRNVAKFNRKLVDETDYEEFRRHCESDQHKVKYQKKANILDMFRTPRMRRNTFILFFKSIVIVFCYDVASRNVEGMGISPFLMFTISAIGVLPASLVLICLQDHMGRKGLTVMAFLLAGVVTGAMACVFIAFTDKELPQITLVCLATAVRFCVAVSYEAGSQYATELIPTCVRGQGVAAVHVAGIVVLFLVPYLLYWGKYFRAAPYLVMCVLLFCGSIVVFLLPETMKKTLPKTIEEGENFGKDEKICSFICCIK